MGATTPSEADCGITTIAALPSLARHDGADPLGRTSDELSIAGAASTFLHAQQHVRRLHHHPHTLLHRRPKLFADLADVDPQMFANFHSKSPINFSGS